MSDRGIPYSKVPWWIPAAGSTGTALATFVPLASAPTVRDWARQATATAPMTPRKPPSNKPPVWSALRATPAPRKLSRMIATVIA